MKDNIKLEEFFYDNVLEHIRSAKIQAEKNHIEANIIILDTGIAMTNHLFMYNNMIQPTIWGMKVMYHDNLANDYNVNFAISRGTNDIKKEPDESQEEIKKLKRLLKNTKISRSMIKKYNCKKIENLEKNCEALKLSLELKNVEAEELKYIIQQMQDISD